MNRYLIGALIGVLILTSFGANFDRRERGDTRWPIARYEFAQQSWASGETGALTATVGNANMLIERMDVLISNATNAITFTVTIADENSVQVLTFAGLAENTNHIKLATKATPDFDAVPVSDNTLTVTITPSGDPGASGATVDVILYGP